MSLMRHDCKNCGCYLDKHVLKFDVFADCFEGKVNFTDIDGLVERDGYFIMQEWKDNISLNTGQEILMKQISDKFPHHLIAFFINGDAETMTVREVTAYIGGKAFGPCKATLQELKKLFRWWDKSRKIPGRMDDYCIWLKDYLFEHKGEELCLK